MDQKKIGAFLKMLRKEKGLTQAQLADHFSVTDRTVSRWENGVHMPDVSLLVALADFYHVEVRELIDGERKDDTVENQTKETLQKVSDYAAEEKNQTVKKTKRKTVAAAAAGLFFVLFVAFALNFFFGNPISRQLAINNAQTILNMQYSNEDYIAVDANYWIEDMVYFVRVESPTDADCAFRMNFGMFGNYRYDDHDEVIRQNKNIVERLNSEYTQRVYHVAALQALPGFEQAVGELLTDDAELSFFNGHVPPPDGFVPLRISDLQFDQPVNYAVLGARSGRISVTLAAEDLSAAHLAETLLQIKELYDAADVHFIVVTLIFVPPVQNGAGDGSSTAAVYNFPYADIYEDGLTERVAAVMTE